MRFNICGSSLECKTLASYRARIKRSGGQRQYYPHFCAVTFVHCSVQPVDSYMWLSASAASYPRRQPPARAAGLSPIEGGFGGGLGPPPMAAGGRAARAARPPLRGVWGGLGPPQEFLSVKLCNAVKLSL